MASSTWESLWQGILTEAALSCCKKEYDSSARSAGVYKLAASVILARTSWQMFFSELVEWRGLTERLKHLNFRHAVVEIHKELSVNPPTFTGGTVWEDLNLVNDIRNEIIHHKAKPLAPLQSPNDLLQRLCERDLLELHYNSLTWECRVLNPRIARWACITVGNAIIELESIPKKRRRSIEGVRQEVTAALHSLSA